MSRHALDICGLSDGTYGQPFGSCNGGCALLRCANSTCKLIMLAASAIWIGLKAYCITCADQRKEQ